MKCDSRARQSYEFFERRYRLGGHRAFTAAQLSAASGYSEAEIEVLHRTQWFWFIRWRGTICRYVVERDFLSVPLLSFLRMCGGPGERYPLTRDDPDFPHAVLPPRLELADEKPIGCGVFGTVYRCRDRVTGVLSAVKVVNPELYWKGSGAGRLLAEVQVARRLGQHDGLVYRLDHGRLKEPSFVEMEWISGISLGQAIGARAPLPFADLMLLATSVTDVLIHAHARGVMHRDLKPENVILAEDGRVVVIDFGLALLDDENGELCAAGRRSGTWAYSAPEAVRGAPCWKSDLYSLGVLLFEAATGRVPRFGLLRRRTEPAPDPRAAEASLDPGFASLLVDLLAFDPEERPSLHACRERLDDLGYRLEASA